MPCKPPRQNGLATDRKAAACIPTSFHPAYAATWVRSTGAACLASTVRNVRPDMDKEIAM